MAFPKGKKNPNAGRPAGAVNKQTLEFKEAVNNLLQYAMPEMVGWLSEIAKESPEKALELIHKYAQFAYPMLARQEVTGRDGDAIDMRVLHDAAGRIGRIIESASLAKSIGHIPALEVDRGEQAESVSTTELP